MKMMKSVAALATVAMFAATGSTAHADVFTDLGVGSEFSTAANWDTNAVPSSGTTSDINGAFTVDRSVNSTSGRTFVDGGAVLNITGGVHNDNNSGNTQRNFIGNAGVGTVNQTAGEMSVGHVLAVGRHGTGTYNLSGGELLVYRGGNSLAGNPNTFGGNAGNSISVGWGNGTGLMNVTGGLLRTRIGVEVGDNGTFQVLGDGATEIGIGSQQSLDGHWWQEAGGVLSMGIGATGVTPIFIDDTGQDPQNPFVHFQSGAVLDMSFFGTAPASGTWTLMELENHGIDDQGLGLAAGDAAAGWSLNVDNTGTNGLLTATFSAIPEPSSLALLGLGGLFLTGRRRK